MFYRFVGKPARQAAADDIACIASNRLQLNIIYQKAEPFEILRFTIMNSNEKGAPVPIEFLDKYPAIELAELVVAVLEHRASVIPMP